jgi:L-alanine-DL-glutamate epimerase-like enolase superfamily enzyme
MAIDDLAVSAYVIPLDEPESDGTLTWTTTTVVVVEPRAEGVRGVGFTYGPVACARLITDVLAEVVVGRDPMDVPGAWTAMVRSVRNAGRPGVASMAIAAVDTALWDLKARLLDQPLARLLGLVRTEVPVYGSGGFLSLTDDAFAGQLDAWVEDGIPRVKIKIDGSDDLRRVALARRTVGPETELFVDANGAYSRKQAVRAARAFAEQDVTWFEEPVSSDDLEGLREVRDLVEADVAAGEYGYDLAYFERMAGVVDVLQADVSRCAGITEWLRAAAVAASHGLHVSGHTAQSLHAHPACAVPNLRHLEYFADHARADRVLLDGVLRPTGGTLRPDLTRPGCGLDLRRSDAASYRVA